MTNTNGKGAIHNPELYAAGKMLDHSGWATILPRGITPSDGDMILDFNGTILFVEFKRTSPYFHDLPKGQLILSKNLVKNGNGKQIAVCAQIDTPLDRQIDTVKDIVAFQVMTTKGTSDVFGRKEWVPFVLWVAGKKV